MAVSSYINRARSIQQLPQMDHLLQTRLLWMFMLRTVLYTALLLIVYFLEATDNYVFIIPSRIFFILIVSIYAFTIFSAFYLLIFQNDQRKFGFIQMSMDTIFSSVLIFCSGISHSNLPIVYCFPIVASGLILPSYGGLVTAALAIFQYGFLLFLEAHEIIPPYLKEIEQYELPTFIQSLNLFSIHGLIFFLTGFLSIFFGQRLRHTENALSSSLEQLGHISLLYQKIFNSISTGILTVDSKHNITSANNAIVTITGLPLHRIIRKKLHDIFPTLEENKESRSTMIYLREREERKIGYSCIPLQSEENTERSNIFDDDELARIIFTMRDITEIESLERQVRQAEKLAAIGTMSASIAHDFRNPLAAISGSAQMLAHEFSDQNDTTNLELTNIILRESNRLTDTIGDFLKFARPEQPDYSWVHLGECIDEVENMLTAGNNFPENVKIERKFPPTIAIWADEKQLFTLLTHLIQNAMPFCPKGEEKLLIEAEEIEDEKNKSNSIQLTVSDNGSGVTEGSENAIFDPFYTTRTDGTGLGLAIVYQIVKDHNGTITVDNNGLPNDTKNKLGASFTVLLPIPDA